VLKLDKVGRHDNFFSLGGHSLLAVGLVNSLKQKNIELSITDVFRYPTIEAVAAQINLSDVPVPPDKAQSIREGNTETPLFLTHEGTGQILYIGRLAPHIHPEIPIYGLPARPEDESQLRTVEGMAARMVQMIRSIQPVGPYRIAGWSFGGILAYEIATQLIGADQEIEFLGLIDTNHVNPVDIPRSRIADFTEREALLTFLRVSSDQDEEKLTTIDAIEAVSETIDLMTLVQKCRGASLFPNFLSGLTNTQIRTWLARARLMSLAGVQYFAQRIPIIVHIFSAQEGREANQDRGWGSLLPENQLSIVPIPGTHHSMMNGRNIQLLGRALSQAIRERAAQPIKLVEKNYLPLFSLQTGRNARSRPLICIPGAGASGTSFMELSICLDEPRSIYGIQPRGLESALVPHSTVSSASEFYLESIMKLFPEEPINLLGHSFGGWVVFDLAQRLIEIGREITSLIIIDSDPPQNQENLIREYSQTEVCTEFIDLLEQVLGHSLNVKDSDFDSRSEVAQIGFLHNILIREGIMPRRSDPDALRGSFRTFAMALRSNYTPSRPYYMGSVQLVLANDLGLRRNVNRERHGHIVETWRRWAPNLVYLSAPGNHTTLLKQPHVRVLAQLLRLDQDPKTK
jgi:arthrofactin-type cyclic lipopeptide synthetase C